MRVYVLRLLCGAMVCGIIRSLCDRQIVRILCAVYLAGLALSPVRGFELELPDWDAIRRQAELVVADGVAQAEFAEDAIIKERCEAYILDEAAALGLSLRAEVTVEDGRPTGATLNGPVSAGDREVLSRSIARNLGIGEEAQTWVPMYQSSLPP